MSDRKAMSTGASAAVPVGDALESALLGWDWRPYRDARVTLVVCDRTRPLPYTETLEPLLAALDLVGAAMTVLVALGLHRPMDEGECEELRRLCGRFGAQLVQHDPASDQLVGSAGGGAWNPRFHRDHILRAERLITVGVVEPHQYAGFSGGIKAISIGCADRQTIAGLHGLSLLRHPGVRVGKIDGNPFQESLWDVALGLPPVSGLFLVPASRGRVFGAAFGEVRDAFERSVAIAREHHFRAHSDRVDWLVARVPKSKALTFYQASRAATYIALVDAPIVRPGGWVLLEASCPEGIGLGSGEQACEEAMRRGVKTLRAELAGRKANLATRGGEQRAYVLAQSLERVRIGLIGPPISALTPMGIPSFSSLAEARGELGLTGSSLVVDDVFRGVPFWAPGS